VRSAIAGYAVALELVNLTRVSTNPEAVVATNVFHRAAIFGARRPTVSDSTVLAAARVDGQHRATADAGTDIADRLAAAAYVLEAVDQPPGRGDLFITGSIVQIPVVAGDVVEAELETSTQYAWGSPRNRDPGPAATRRTFRYGAPQGSTPSSIYVQ
jgi:hypothetical protein